MSQTFATSGTHPLFASTALPGVNGGVLDLVGNTPCVDVSNLSPNPDVRIVAKLEMQNPFGSVKDRIAKAMIEAAEADGTLSPGQTIIEPSSGNTGIALAAIARLKGYPIKILLPESVSIERRQMLEIMGAEVILTPGAEGSNGAVRRATEMAAEHPEWRLIYQYGNEANPAAHEFGTALGIVRDWPLEAPPDHFLCAYGTGGTITGNSRGLRTHYPDIAVHSVEEDLNDTIGGMRNQEDPFQPPVADFGLVKDRYVIGRTQAEAKVQEIMAEEGYFVGTSAGAVIEAAQRELSKHGGTAVVILPDAGWKYLSGNPWQ